MSYSEAVQLRRDDEDFDFSVFDGSVDGKVLGQEVLSQEVKSEIDKETELFYMKIFGNEGKDYKEHFDFDKCSMKEFTLIESPQHDENIQVCKAMLGHLPVMYIELDDDEALRQEKIYNCHGHQCLLKFIFLHRKETLKTKVVFEDKLLRSFRKKLVNESLGFKISAIFKISEIFLYFESKGVAIYPSLDYFCLDENNNPILINLEDSKEIYLMAPETLAYDIKEKATSSWALGMLIVEILTDKHPFSDESFSSIRQMSELYQDESEVREKYLNYIFGKEFNTSFLKCELNLEIFEELIINIRDLLKPLAKDRIPIEDVYKEIMKVKKLMIKN